jgi:hypothetical protein
MKKKLIIILSVVLVTVIGITVAQVMTSKKNPRLSAEKRAELQTKKMTGIYNLSEDQQSKIYLVNLEYQQKELALLQNKAENNMQKSTEAELRDEHEQKVLPILTEDQKIKWNQHKEYRKTHPREEKK